MDTVVQILVIILLTLLEGVFVAAEIALVTMRRSRIDQLVDEEVSLGDFVISGGDLAAMVLIDAVVRLLPGALGDDRSALQDSFSLNEGLLDCPHYTRPEVWGERAVPPVLMSGHHAEIERWRLKQSLGRTWLRRPELLLRRGMSAEESKLLEEFQRESHGKEQ